MEIQFSIKFIGAQGSAAVPKRPEQAQPAQNQDDERIEGVRLGGNVAESAARGAEENAGNPVGRAGGGGDGLGPGGGEAGTGQVIVIGPIVITCPASGGGNAGKGGGGGDPLDPGGQGRR